MINLTVINSNGVVLWTMHEYNSKSNLVDGAVCTNDGAVAGSSVDSIAQFLEDAIGVSVGENVLALKEQKLVIECN